MSETRMVEYGTDDYYQYYQVNGTVFWVRGGGDYRRIIARDGSELGCVEYLGAPYNLWKSSFYSKSTGGDATGLYFQCGNDPSHSSLEAALITVVSWAAGHA